MDYSTPFSQIMTELKLLTYLKALVTFSFESNSRYNNNSSLRQSLFIHLFTSGPLIVHTGFKSCLQLWNTVQRSYSTDTLLPLHPRYVPSEHKRLIVSGSLTSQLSVWLVFWSRSNVFGKNCRIVSRYSCRLQPFLGTSSGLDHESFKSRSLIDEFSCCHLMGRHVL